MFKPVPLQHGQFYHVYNRGNNRQALFVEERNYRYFLTLYARHVEPVAETYAYCLLPNHFHFLVRIQDLTGLQDLSGLKLPSQCFSNLFNAYARAFNKAYGRTGSLFQRPFGRVPVTSDAHFVWLIAYIHRNPQKHGLVDDFGGWPYSSYHTFLSTKATRLKRDDVLAWFEGAAGFQAFHRQQIAASQIAPLVAEDFD
jgi:REP-associated tyrosine transposase